MMSHDFFPGTKGAVFSPCGTFRYALWRIWSPSLPLLLSIGLNPSTAGADKNDATIRRDIGYASAWRFGGLLKGNLFAFWEAMTTLPDYYVNVFCPVSSSNWLPQRRDRLIIIGSRRKFGWREPRAQKRLRLAEILELEPNVSIPRYVEKRIKGGYRDRPIVSDPDRDDLAPTCVAHYSKDLSTRLVVDRRFPFGLRPYTVREYARLQGVPDSFQFAGTDRDAYRMIGNGVSVPVGEWLGREIMRYFN